MINDTDIFLAVKDDTLRINCAPSCQQAAGATASSRGDNRSGFQAVDPKQACTNSLCVGWRPSSDENGVLDMCRKNQWIAVLDCVRRNPSLACAVLQLDNHVSTTILHQAITSKGNCSERKRVIRQILSAVPQAASIKNSFGSLPLHAISQRNVSMDAATKELLIKELVCTFKFALNIPAGKGKRTPLHIILTGMYSI